MPYKPVEKFLKHKNLTLRNYIHLLYNEDTYIDPVDKAEYESYYFHFKVK
jgi:hypothetical protein